MNKTLKSISKIFNYSFKERIFIFMLLITLAIMFTLPKMLYLFDSQVDRQSNDFLQYANKIDSFINHTNQIENETYAKTKEQFTASEKITKNQASLTPIRFVFNPGTISLDSLKALGISKKTAQNLTKFRKHGFRYQKAEDFNKIYGISTQELAILKEYAMFPIKQDPPKKFKKKQATDTKKSFAKTEIKKTKVESKPVKLEKPSIEVNTASEEQWQSLHGIGPYYAMRICKFRDQLGGFITIDQVADTYNLPDSVFQMIKPQLILEGTVKKIAVLKSDKETLANHPFISYKQAAIIEKYIAHRKDSFNLEMMYKIQAFDSNYIKKIMPYLEL